MESTRRIEESTISGGKSVIESIETSSETWVVGFGVDVRLSSFPKYDVFVAQRQSVNLLRDREREREREG